MSQLALEEPPIRLTKLGRFRAWLVFLGIASIVVFGVIAIYTTAYKTAEDDTKQRMAAEIVNTGVSCELTGEAVADSRGAGFMLKAKCPDGIAHVPPSLSLWTRMVEALPSEKRNVQCAVRKDGKYTDCRKSDEVAGRDGRRERRD